MPVHADHNPPPPGKEFKHTFKGVSHTMTVVSEGGRTMYRVGGRVFKSPSAAAKSVAGHAVNGWKFWHIDQ
jgi:hypothetical protein